MSAPRLDAKALDGFGAKLVVASILAYALLSAACLWMPELIPDRGIGGHIALGPPALLFWGASIVPLFAGVTIVLAALLFCAFKWEEAGPFALCLAIVLWCAAGWFSAALSI